MIEVKNVTKKYGKFVAVKDLSFSVDEQEIVGFLGPNGAGKSTTMNMITGYIEPSKGKIIVNGYDVSKSPKKAKRQIGYMPENVPLYNDLTVKEFIKYMAELKNVKRKDRKAEVEKVIEETGLKDVQKKLIKKISRGYKQRVSLAGALVGNPEILILDEPTVGLDPKQITEIRSLIKKLGKSHTVILSSHILSEVSQICKKVIIINKGKILAIDTPENLEKQTQAENSIVITVEDKKNKMEKVVKNIADVKEIKLVKDNEDGTKQYIILTKKEKDIRKDLFELLPKESITIFELKQTETTLEDAFLKVINNKEAELEKARNKEKEDKEKREKELEQMDKKERRKAIKEDKKAKKKAKKDEFNAEWEKEKELAKKEKEELKKKKQDKKMAKKENKNKKKLKENTEKEAKASINKKVEDKKLEEIKENKKETNDKPKVVPKKIEIKKKATNKTTAKANQTKKAVAKTETKNKAKTNTKKAPTKKVETKKGGNK